MKLSTRSRYGTRLMLDLARHYGEGLLQIGEIAKHENISVKYLEQLIIPLKKGGFIKSIRGPKGGHELAISPEKVTIGRIVRILEGGIDLSGCVEHPDQCARSRNCLTRGIWKEATNAVYEKLDATTLEMVLERGSVRR